MEGLDSSENRTPLQTRSEQGFLWLGLSLGACLLVVIVLLGLGPRWFVLPLLVLAVSLGGYALASARRGRGNPSRVGKRRAEDEPAATPPAAVASVDEAEAQVARLWRIARQVPTEAARERAFRVCAAADRVAEALAQDKADPQLVGWFVERHLAPTEALLERYTRLAQRRVAAAEPALARVEEHDLPLLESRLDALYQQLHRGDVVDLSVASEMLELGGLDDRPPEPSRRLST